MTTLIIILAIVLIAAERGFLEALLFGVLAGCVIFAVDVSRIRVIRHQFGLDERTSSVIRSTPVSPRWSIRPSTCRLSRS